MRDTKVIGHVLVLGAITFEHRRRHGPEEQCKRSNKDDKGYTGIKIIEERKARGNACRFDIRLHSGYYKLSTTKGQIIARFAALEGSAARVFQHGALRMKPSLGNAGADPDAVLVEQGSAAIANSWFIERLKTLAGSGAHWTSAAYSVQRTD